MVATVFSIGLVVLVALLSQIALQESKQSFVLTLLCVALSGVLSLEAKPLLKARAIAKATAKKAAKEAAPVPSTTIMDSLLPAAMSRQTSTILPVELNLGPIRNQTGMERGEDCEKVLLQPFNYITEEKGKEVRNQLIDAFNLWLKVEPVVLDEIKKLISQLHNASLMIDDIEDGSKLRRGRPVAHLVYGQAETINCANLVYFQAMDVARRMQNPKVLPIFVTEMVALHRGQGLDLHWREKLICPSIEEYLVMVTDKTGGVFRLATLLMAAFSKDTRSYVGIANLLGLFFQIRDDYINLTDLNYMVGKSFCEDLTEGKMSFPIIHAIRSRPNDTRLINILKQRTEDVNIKKLALTFLHQSESLEYTRKALLQIRAAVDAELKALGGNKMLEKIVEKLSEGLDTPAPAPELPTSN